MIDVKLTFLPLSLSHVATKLSGEQEAEKINEGKKVFHNLTKT
jgi:hypothetical protein